MRSFKVTKFGAALEEVVEEAPAPVGTEVLLRVNALGTSIQGKFYLIHTPIHQPGQGSAATLADICDGSAPGAICR